MSKVKSSKNGKEKVNANIKKEEKTMKKEMKKVEKVDFGSIRKMFNRVMTSNKGLTLVENKHGAVQVKRNGDVLFSARSDGKMIISHPMFEGTGKKKVQVFSPGGSMWNDRSQVPFDKVTQTMLEARIKDQKSQKDHTAEVYGKDKTASGLFVKAEAARLRAEKITKEAGKKTDKKAGDKTAAKAARAKVTKPVTKKARAAIAKVRKPAIA